MTSQAFKHLGNLSRTNNLKHKGAKQYKFIILQYCSSEEWCKSYSAKEMTPSKLHSFLEARELIISLHFPVSRSYQYSLGLYPPLFSASANEGWIFFTFDHSELISVVTTSSLFLWFFCFPGWLLGNFVITLGFLRLFRIISLV